MLSFLISSFLFSSSLSQQGIGETCGTIVGLACESGLTCALYTSQCDPECGASDCGGVCVDASNGKFCGGIGSIECPDDLVCIPNPLDKCSPNCGGADCGGICIEPLSDCQLPVDPGPCRGSFRRWYFDSNSNTCREFVYGGCLGNANNFETEDDCFGKCLGPVCEQPVDSGPCEALIQRYYYDSDRNKCRKFTYGGCDGNQNNFETRKDCRRKCKTPNRCLLEPDIGPCDGICPRWYYDDETKTCKEFNYGCCGGNKNNFKSEKFCLRKCFRG